MSQAAGDRSALPSAVVLVGRATSPDASRGFESRVVVSRSTKAPSADNTLCQLASTNETAPGPDGTGDLIAVAYAGMSANRRSAEL